MEIKESRGTVTAEEEQMGRSVLWNTETYYKAITMKMMWYGYGDRHAAIQQDRAASLSGTENQPKESSHVPVKAPFSGRNDILF